MKWLGGHLLRILGLMLICTVALQLYFLGRITLMVWLSPESTTFQRSEIARLLRETHELRWHQEWVDSTQISKHLKSAVIAAEDADFIDHGGVEWDALESAWERNQTAQKRAEKINQNIKPTHAKNRTPAVAKMVGGSTITQQLAKNLFLASERNLSRKAQEMAITFMLEALLSKERILEIYLNNVEWGAGVFGAQAASAHYFRTSAAKLGQHQAARLAVMLPAPKKFEKKPASAYMLSRAATIQARMSGVELP